MMSAYDLSYAAMCSFQGAKPVCMTPTGDEGIRTPDPLLARQVLSQLSYTPMIPAPTCFSIPSPV